MLVAHASMSTKGSTYRIVKASSNATGSWHLKLCICIMIETLVGRMQDGKRTTFAPSKLLSAAAHDAADMLSGGLVQLQGVSENKATSRRRQARCQDPSIRAPPASSQRNYGMSGVVDSKVLTKQEGSYRLGVVHKGPPMFRNVNSRHAQTVFCSCALLTKMQRGWGGAGSQPRPHLQTQCSRDGFQRDCFEASLRGSKQRRG